MRRDHSRTRVISNFQRNKGFAVRELSIERPFTIRIKPFHRTKPTALLWNFRYKKARLLPAGLFCISIGRDGRIRTSYPLHPIKVTACPSPSNRIYKPLNISKLVKNTSLHCPTTSTRIHRKRLRNGDGTVTRFRSIHGHHHR